MHLEPLGNAAVKGRIKNIDSPRHGPMISQVTGGNDGEKKSSYC